VRQFKHLTSGRSTEKPGIAAAIPPQSKRSTNSTGKYAAELSIGLRAAVSGQPGRGQSRLANAAVAILVPPEEVASMWVRGAGTLFAQTLLVISRLSMAHSQLIIVLTLWHSRLLYSTDLRNLDLAK